ncbi:MAG: GNAT family N-acetyltransferase [Saprospiraceae bacterium]
MNVTFEVNDIPQKAAIISLYKANHWSSANKSDELYMAIKNSQMIVSAYNFEKLVGFGNALSDGHLVVYYPHLLVHPDFHGKGIGTSIMKIFQKTYSGFHQQILVADAKAIDFYRKCGFDKGGQTQSMWIYQGDDH